VEARALLEMAFPLALVSGDFFTRALDRVLEAQLRFGEADSFERIAVRALYLSQRMNAGQWEPGDMEECRTLVAKLREAEDRRLLAEVQLGFGYTLRNFSQYREAQQSAVEGFAILLAGYEENPYLGFNFQQYEHLVCSCQVFLGEWGEALRRIEQRVEMVERNGDRQSAIIAGLMRSRVQIYAMDFAGAQHFLESSLPLLTSIPHHARLWMTWAGSAEAGLGNHDQALKHLLRCRNDMEQEPLITDWYNRLPLQRALTEAWLSKGDLEKARVEAEEFLKVTLATGDRTFRALAFEVNARVVTAEGDLPRARDCITQAVQAMEGYEVPLAHWRAHATAYELYQRMKQRDAAKKHRELSRATIMKLVNSLPVEEPLRRIFLSAPAIRKILGDGQKPVRS